jgi:hypothetical protein
MEAKKKANAQLGNGSSRDPHKHAATWGEVGWDAMWGHDKNNPQE